MEQSRLDRLIADFEQSLDKPISPHARQLITQAMLTFPQVKPVGSGDHQLWEKREHEMVCTFADHLEKLLFSQGVIPPMQPGEVNPVINLLARVRVDSADGQKLLALWEKLCEILTTEESGRRSWVRYRYPCHLRDAFLKGMISARTPREIQLQVLRVCTSTLGTNRKPTTGTDDGGSWHTARLTEFSKDIGAFVKGQALTFGADNLLSELDRIRKLPVSGQESRKVLNRGLVNVIMERLRDDSLLATEVLRQVDRLFPRNGDTGNMLEALQALKVPK